MGSNLGAWGALGGAAGGFEKALLHQMDGARDERLARMRGDIQGANQKASDERRAKGQLESDTRRAEAQEASDGRQFQNQVSLEQLRSNQRLSEAGAERLADMDRYEDVLDADKNIVGKRDRQTNEYEPFTSKNAYRYQDVQQSDEFGAERLFILDKTTGKMKEYNPNTGAQGTPAPGGEPKPKRPSSYQEAYDAYRTKFPDTKKYPDSVIDSTIRSRFPDLSKADGGEKSPDPVVEAAPEQDHGSSAESKPDQETESKAPLNKNWEGGDALTPAREAASLVKDGYNGLNASLVKRSYKFWKERDPSHKQTPAKVLEDYLAILDDPIEKAEIEEALAMKQGAPTLQELAAK